MVYFDNAATTKEKPRNIYESVYNYLVKIGVSPGRGSYQLGIKASRTLYQVRCMVGEYFGLTEADRVIFTKNSTEAINMFVNGILHEGDHVLITCFEHNAVLRPIETLHRSGLIDYDIIQLNDLEMPPEEIYEKYATEKTRLMICTLASNLTGRIVFREDVFKTFQQHGIKTFVDASQGAGYINLSMKEQGIDYLAFTGHKDLLALPGVGGLCCEGRELPEPLIQGGTGINGEEYVNPSVFPEGYEAGTLNMPAIVSLGSSIEYLNANKAMIGARERSLLKMLLEALDAVEKVIIYDRDAERVPTFCFNIKSTPSDRVVAFLDEKEICVRGGIHCAILAHEAIKTVESGAVRVSLGFQNTEADVEEFCNAIKELCR